MKTVLITGGSRGIGAAIASKYKENGYNVITPTREELNLKSLDSIKKYINANCNLRLDALINNAGVNELATIEEVTDENIEETMNVNLIAPIMLMRAFVPLMKTNNISHIVNITSIWAVVSKEKRVTYAASKRAMNGVTNTLAVELAANNILVNSVAPGFTATELTYKNNSKDEILRYCKEIPLNRMAKPEEIANVVYWIGSNNNTYITGQELLVDGGFTVK